MSRPSPDRGDLAGRWLSKFLTEHLAGERDLSPQTIASYRDAIKLLLTWFRDVQATPPEKLRLADLDRQRVLAFLDWLHTERGNSAATRNQRLAVIKSFARYTAIERPEFLDQATQIIAVKQKKTPATDMGYLTGDEVKALLAQPDPATRRGPRGRRRCSGRRSLGRGQLCRRAWRAGRCRAARAGWSGRVRRGAL